MRTGTTLDRTLDRVAIVADMTKAGHTAAEIADRLGVTRRSVGRMRARAGLTSGVQIPRWTPEQVELFDRLLTEGWAYAEIADTYKVSYSHLATRFPGRGWTAKQKVELRECRRKLDAIPDGTGRPLHYSRSTFNARQTGKMPTAFYGGGADAGSGYRMSA